MCSLGYCHAFLLSTAGVVGLELFLYSRLSGTQEHMLLRTRQTVSRFILFDDENISFGASFFLYIQIVLIFLQL
jgi:hypothetical protein